MHYNEVSHLIHNTSHEQVLSQLVNTAANDLLDKFNLGVTLYQIATNNSEPEDAQCEALRLILLLYPNLNTNPFLVHFVNRLLDPNPKIQTLVCQGITNGDDGNGNGNGLQRVRESLVRYQHYSPVELNKLLNNVIIVAHRNITSPTQQHVLCLNNILDIIEIEFGLVESTIDPQTWVSFTILEKCFTVTDDHYADMAISKIKRVKASMKMVDLIHKVTVSGLLKGDAFREVLYEFVEYNLSSNSDQLTCVRLLAVLILSLHDKGFLKPLVDYHALFSGFVKWIATIPEARQVYQLSM